MCCVALKLNLSLLCLMINIVTYRMARHICEPRDPSQERSRGRDEKNNTWEVSHESRTFCHRHLEKQYWAAFETMHVGRTLFFWPKKNLPFFDDSFKLALQIYKLMTLVLV